MRVAALVVLRLAAFLAAAGLVYAVTSHESAGGSLLLVAGAALFVASAAGWFVDVRRQHQRGHRP